MVFNDIIQDYQFITSNLYDCKEYFTKCQAVIDCYYKETALVATKYYTSNSTDNTRSTFTSEMSTVMSKCFSQITKLNSSSYSFFSCLGKLTSQKYHSAFLFEKIQRFQSLAQTTIISTNNIIEEQLDGMKRKNLLTPFIKSAQELLCDYYNLEEIYLFLLHLENELLEPLPNGIDENDFKTFELRSYKTGYSLSEYTEDLSNLSSFITQFEMLYQNQGKSAKLYLRKFESGSLRIVWAGKTIELSGIPEIIKAITEGIRTFRLTTIKIKQQQEEIRTQKLENDEKELAIINSQLSAISNTLGLSKDNPEDVEKIQRLCLPLVRYINNNPEGQVGDYKYNITSEVKLLEDFYFKDQN